MKFRINELDVYPAAKFRLSYDVSALREDIRKHGQLQPGRVIYRDGKPYVYIGVRRFYALKQLYEETGDERFLYYEAEVDSIASDEQIIERAIAENSDQDTGSTIRTGITPLEIIPIAKRYGSIAQYIPKKYSALLNMPEDVIAELSKIQADTKYVFSYQLLHRLLNVNRDALPFVARTIATMKAEEKTWDFVIRRASEEFKSLNVPQQAEHPSPSPAPVPEAHVQATQHEEPVAEEPEEHVAEKTEPPVAEEPEEPEETEETEEPEEQVAEEQHEEPARIQPAPGPAIQERAEQPASEPEEILKTRQIIDISCPHCGYRSPMIIKGSQFSVEFINRDTDETESVEADNVLRTERLCPKCGNLVYITIKVESVKDMKYRVSVSKDANPKVIEVPVDYPAVEYLGWTGTKWVRIGAFGKATGEYRFE